MKRKSPAMAGARMGVRKLLWTVGVLVVTAAGFSSNAAGESATFNTSGPGTWTAPAGVTSVTVEGWGGGGAGGEQRQAGGGGGGGGGAYAKGVVPVTPGVTYDFVIGGGGATNGANGGNTTFNTTSVVAEGGKTALQNSATGGEGGLAANSFGDVTRSGGNGANGVAGSYGGGGGGSAGTDSPGAAGSGSSGAAAVTGGGPGGDGATAQGGGSAPLTGPGGGGGGAYRTGNGNSAGGAGAVGQIVLSWISPATLSSPTAASITSSAAMLGATISSDGGGTITARGTVWGLAPSPTGNPAEEGGTAVGVFSHSRTGLPAGTLIYYRGYATNSGGATGYSPDGSFYTEPSAQASGVNFTGVGPNSMTVNWTRGTAGDGVIVLVKAASAVTGVPVDGTYTSYTANTTYGSGTLIGDGYVVHKGAGSSVTVTNLEAGATYHVAVFEYKGEVDTSGDNLGANYLGTPAIGSQAAAPASPPTLSTPTATLLESTTATLGANITASNGAPITQHGTCWGATAAPSGNCSTLGAIGTGIFTDARTGITASARIFYRGYATNSAGTGYSPDGSFYTEPSLQASGINFTALTGGGMTVNWTRGNGDGVIVLMRSGAAVATDPADGTYTGYTADAAFGSGTAIGAAYVVYNGTGSSVTVSGLAAGTTYHVAVYEYKGTVDTAGVDQGTNYRETPATGSQTAQCVEYVTSSLAFNGVNTAAGNFNGASMVTPVDLTNLEYRVTSTTTVPGPSTPSYYLQGDTTTNLGADGTANLPTAQSTGTAIPYRGTIVEMPANATSWRPGSTDAGTDKAMIRGYSPVYSYDTVISGIAASLAVRSANLGYVWSLDLYDYDPVTGTKTLLASSPGGSVTATATTEAVNPGAFTISNGGLVQSGHRLMMEILHTSGGASTGERVYYGGTAALTGSWVTLTETPVAETVMLDWNPDPQEASSVLTDGQQYILYARGIEAECGVDTYYVGGTTEPGAGQTFTWNACSENQTLTLDTVADPLSGTTATISATGTAGSIKVGDSSPPTQNSPWTYNIPQDSTASVTFYAQGAGDCGTLTSSQTVTLATMAAPIVTDFVIPATVVDTEAPLEIPITTFTATDNVAVTGYLITESATPPSAGAAGWSGTAPTSYTVAAYGSYTLYAWAKDAAGNVSSSVSASTTVTDCTETVTGVALDEPIANPIEGATVISATKSGTGGGTPQVRWTVDGGTPSAWQNSGATFTPPANNSIGSVLFEAQVAGSCGGTITDPTPVTVAYDSRLPGLTTQTAFGAQASTTSITVTMPYLGDKNGDATFQVDYKLSTSGTWTVGTPVNPNPEVNPYIVTLSGLTADSTYNIRVTYADPDGVTGTAIQTFDVTLFSWVDNYLLHNSNRFSCDKPGFFRDQAECEDPAAGGTWSLGKWGKPWGTSDVNDQYGPIMCSTCHVKNAAPNIKRIKGTVTAAKNSFPGSIVEATSSVPNTSSDYGDDSDNHTTSTRVCAVCHSQNKYHNYDTANNLAKGGDLSHYNSKDCISCHAHQGGFRASCNACHGNPPTVDTVGSPGLANNPGPTGSTTAGKHVRHVTDPAGPQYTCEKCHSSPFGSGPNHTFTMSVTVSFEAFGSTAGTYYGQSTVTSYDGSVGAKNDSLTCAATYCHGGTIGGVTPTWKATGTSACGSCHGASAAAPPASPASGLSHATHAGNASAAGSTNIYRGGAVALACSACHGANGAGTSGHLDGRTQFDVTALTADYRAGSNPVMYKAAQSGDSGALARVNPYSTCTNSACHWGTTTPAWNAAPATCTSCHNNGTNSGLLADAAPASGSHAVHVTANPAYVTCDSCHGTNANSGTHSGHLNNITDFGGALIPGTNFTDVGGRANTADTCSVNCHIDGTWGGALNWSGGVVDACTDCHSNAYAGKAGPTVVVNWATTPTGSHLKATRSSTLPSNAMTAENMTAWKNLCNQCHTKHSGPVQVPLPPISWDNPGTAVVETTNMRTQLGINYVGADHGAIKLGGTATSGSTEADLCWNCHDTAANAVSEWGYNTDTNGATFPTTIIPDRDGVSQGSHNYGWVYTTEAARDANTIASRTSAWVDAAGNGYWHRDGYSTLPRLQRRITSVHSVNFDPTLQRSSVGTAVNATTGVITPTAQEKPADIRCSYCHDVHDLNLAVADTNTGRPFLRGSWMGNPYPPDIPPVGGTGGDVYPNSGAGANAYMFTSTGNYSGKPRLFSTSTQKGGYFLDANSGRPTTNANYNTVAKTAGICTLCHGTDVDNMDFYPNSNAATKMWRSDQVNGHANSALGGSGASHANARKLFDARRGTAANPGVLPVYMGAQDALWLRVTPLNPNFNYGKQAYEPNATFTAGTVLGTVPAGAVPPQNTAPHRTWNPSQPGNSGHGGMDGLPMRIIGWYGGTAKGDVTKDNQSTLPSEFFNWYSSTGIGTDGSGSGRAHSFTCSKCHTPHASGLPALLTTNCLDTRVSTWGTAAYGPNATGTFGQRVAVTCHRNEGTTTGWHKLAPDQ